MDNTPIWTPLPGPQTEAYFSDADVLFFGGAGGGGKSALGVGLTVTQHHKSLVLRQEGKQTRELADYLAQILGTRDGYNRQDMVWRRRVSGIERLIEFGGLKNEGDEEAYRGRPHDLLVVDEAPTMREHQVRFVMAWVRTTLEGQRTRVLLTGNPPKTVEGLWIIDMFAPWLDKSHDMFPHKPGELLWYAMLDGEDTIVDGPEPFTHKGEQITPKSRTFIPSRVEDNPFLLETGYKAQLQALPEPLRSQMLRGDFEAGKEDQEWQVIPTDWVEAAMRRWKPQDEKGVMTGMGLDPARGGKDEAALAARYGWWYDELIIKPGRIIDDGPKAAAMVAENQRNGCPVHVDVIGIGSSAFDFLKTTNIHTVEVQSAAATGESDKSSQLKFANRRALMWWKFRERLDPVNTENLIMLPPDDELKKELCAPIYMPGARGILVEDKESIRKRLKRSTNRADAVIYAAEETPFRTHRRHIKRGLVK